MWMRLYRVPPALYLFTLLQSRFLTKIAVTIMGDNSGLLIGSPVSHGKTRGSRDAAAKPTGMYLRRVLPRGTGTLTLNPEFKPKQSWTPFRNSYLLLNIVEAGHYANSTFV